MFLIPSLQKCKIWGLIHEGQKHSICPHRINILMDYDSLILKLKHSKLSQWLLQSFTLWEMLFFPLNITLNTSSICFLVAQNMALSLIYKGNKEWLLITVQRLSIWDRLYYFHNTWNILGIFYFGSILFHVLTKNIFLFLTCRQNGISHLEIASHYFSCILPLYTTFILATCIWIF